MSLIPFELIGNQCLMLLVKLKTNFTHVFKAPFNWHREILKAQVKLIFNLTSPMQCSVHSEERMFF